MRNPLKRSIMETEESASEKFEYASVLLDYRYHKKLQHKKR